MKSWVSCTVLSLMDQSPQDNVGLWGQMLVNMKAVHLLGTLLNESDVQLQIYLHATFTICFFVLVITTHASAERFLMPKCWRHFYLACIHFFLLLILVLDKATHAAAERFLSHWFKSFLHQEGFIFYFVSLLLENNLPV